MTEGRKHTSPELSARELTWNAENLWISLSSAFDQNRAQEGARENPYTGIVEIQTPRYAHYFVALGLGHIEYLRFTQEETPTVDHLRIKIRGADRHQVTYDRGLKGELIKREGNPSADNPFVVEQGKRLVRELDQDLQEAGKPRPMIFSNP
jgi:hypothetical protein